MGLAGIAIEDLGRVTLRDRRYDGCLCDPPYGLEFMGRDWDRGVPGPRLWRVVWEALKPGAWLMAFGGTRTYHRMASAVEDAGFEVKDCLMWLYGSGFPKGVNVSKGIDGRLGFRRPAVGEAVDRRGDGTRYGLGHSGVLTSEVAVSEGAKRWAGYKSCLKPAYEPVLLAQKPFEEGGFVQAAMEDGVGGLNIDGCRVGSAGGCRSDQPYVPTQDSVHCYGNGLNIQGSPRVEGLGRYPANLLLDPEAAEMLDAQSGVSKSRASAGVKLMPGTKYHTPNLYGGIGGQVTPDNQYSDEGGASRFFKVITSGEEDEEAEEDWDPRMFWVPKVSPRERGESKHETMKPLRLCEYLARLILPPATPELSRRLLVPFSGSGSEMIGGLRAGWEEVTGVEKEGEYAMTAFNRIEAEGHEVRFL